jgi:hypothetical protein
MRNLQFSDSRDASMTTPINLTQLRERVINPQSSAWPCTQSELLALIDTAEAALPLADKLHIIAASGKRRRQVDRLRETLNPYTTTP